MDWTHDQQKAIEVLNRGTSCFITGGAGTGKSTVMRQWIRESTHDSDSRKKLAVLASTGTAALMMGGRTFHRFFGLGIMEGGKEAVIERALKSSSLKSRIKKTHTVLIDEISMIGAQEWETAEAIARKVLGKGIPWGGLRIIVVGDFAQLPPVQKPWVFQSPTWHETDLRILELKTIVRSEESSWAKVMSELRWGQLSKSSLEILESRVQSLEAAHSGTRLFTRKFAVESYNQEQLNHLPGTPSVYSTLYVGKANRIDEIKKQAPIPEELVLKEKALVMFRNNDPEMRWVNGTLGYVVKLPSPSAYDEGEIEIELLRGKRVKVEKANFGLLDAEGEVIASAKNYPLNLAWACTIHKAQGATLDQLHVDLSGTWEHGQAYVALSRVRKLEQLTLEAWNPRWIIVDPLVRQYYSSLEV